MGHLFKRGTTTRLERLLSTADAPPWEEGLPPLVARSLPSLSSSLALLGLPGTPPCFTPSSPRALRPIFLGRAGPWRKIFIVGCLFCVAVVQAEVKGLNSVERREEICQPMKKCASFLLRDPMIAVQ